MADMKGSEELCEFLTEHVALVADENNNSYEECIIHHSTALKTTQDVIHPKYRSPKTLPKCSEDADTKALPNLYQNSLFVRPSIMGVSYQDTILINQIDDVTQDEDVTHISYNPPKKVSVPSVAYEDTVITQRKVPKNEHTTPHYYEDTLVLPHKGCDIEDYFSQHNVDRLNSDGSSVSDHYTQLSEQKDVHVENKLFGSDDILNPLTISERLYGQESHDNQSDSEEDLAELPRFRSRAVAHNTAEMIAAAVSARELRKMNEVELEYDDTEMRRTLHEEEYGISLMNQLRELVPPKQPANRVSSKVKQPVPAVTSPHQDVGSCSHCSSDVPCNVEELYTQVNKFPRKDEQRSPVVTGEGIYSTAIAQNKLNSDDLEDALYCSTVGSIRIPSTAKWGELYSTAIPTTVAAPKRQKTQKISREDSSKFLAGGNVGDYILRTNKDNTILTVKVHEKIKHFKLEITEDSVRVGKESFSSLEEMISFYKTSNPVSQQVSPVYLRDEVVPMDLDRMKTP